MVKITISSKKEENFKEGDLVFGAALSWEDPGSHMDAFIVGEIDKEKFLYTCKYSTERVQHRTGA